MSEIIVSVSGVRGIVGDSLTPQNIIKYVSAFAEYCKLTSKSNEIVVGRDGRLHGEIIADIVVNTLRLAGFNVIYIGIVPTPTVQIATEDLKAAGGISITASHNPQIWNGLKFLNPNGTFLDELQVREFISIAEKGNFVYADIEKLGSVKDDLSWLKKHVNKVLKLKIINKRKIQKRKFTVVVDTVNSSGSAIVPDLLEKLGCKVIKLFCDGSGKFPHTPEPLPENLVQLSKAVKKHKADFGVAIDPDSDRMVLITDKGEPFIEENTITCVTNFVLRTTKNKNKIAVVNLSTTRAVDDVAELFDGKVYRSAVGEINVVKEMMKNDSVIGGEGSGGVIYPELHYGRDAIVGLALFLNELADFSEKNGKKNGKLSDYKNTLPQYHIAKAKIENVADPDKVLNAVAGDYIHNGCEINTLDGVKLDFEDYWIHLRKSNTEPVIRIITEAKNKESAEQIQNTFIDYIKGLI